MTTPQLTLYNTLTRTKEAFTPLDATNVRMYVCGPTVYDFAHIGNARPVIVFDLLFRLLRHVYGAEHVTYARNITDVDDKINARALRDFPDLPLNDAIRRVTEKTETQFLSDAARLGNLPPTYQPRATDFVLPRPDAKPDMVSLIKTLIAKGNAYEANGEVLFSVQSMPDYGQLSGRNLDDNLAGARIAVDAHKRNPADFVLWKQSSADEPGWDSPWGRGRPGWHIECSAMSAAYLGEVFDIHGGGLDLIFPHHENEIAQSRCAHGTHAMANVWMHNGFLQVEGQKMSKSLGNFYTISQLLDGVAFGGRKWPGEVLRLAMLMTHYREPIDFSVRRLEEAESILQRLRRARNSAMHSQGGEILGDASVEQHVPNTLEIGYDGIVRFLADDLNTAAAIQTMQSLARAASAGVVAAGASLINAALLLGIRLDPPAEQLTSDADVAVETGIAARLAALNARDFARADAIRNELAEQGIALMDYKDENGERQTRWEVKR
jgi:cysteinyl-tRNA synthetase